MVFDELWKQVSGLPDTAILEVPEVLREKTKQQLAKLTPEDVSEIVGQVIDEVDRGAISYLDELISNKLLSM